MLFGGAGADPSGASRLLDDTWEWDGTTWTERSPATRPPARFSGEMVAFGDKLVLFGGSPSGADPVFADTWEWDGTTWTERSPASRPLGRHGHAMAALGDRVVLHGGNFYTGTLGDTWEWDGTTWTERTGIAGPTARFWHRMATLGGKVVLCGGALPDYAETDQMWEWSGSAWTELTPPVNPGPRAQVSLAPLGSSLVLFGGLDGTGEASGNHGDTWVWNGTTWTERVEAATPPGAYLATTGRMVSLGDRVLLTRGAAPCSSPGGSRATPGRAGRRRAVRQYDSATR